MPSESAATPPQSVSSALRAVPFAWSGRDDQHLLIPSMPGRLQNLVGWDKGIYP